MFLESSSTKHPWGFSASRANCSSPVSLPMGSMANRRVGGLWPSSWQQNPACSFGMIFGQKSPDGCSWGGYHSLGLPSYTMRRLPSRCWHTMSLAEMEPVSLPGQQSSCQWAWYPLELASNRCFLFQYASISAQGYHYDPERLCLDSIPCPMLVDLDLRILLYAFFVEGWFLHVERLICHCLLHVLPSSSSWRAASPTDFSEAYFLWH